MLNDEQVMGLVLQNAYRKGHLLQHQPKVKSDVAEKEALEIFNELLDVFIKHNVSYQCACRISLALNEAFLTGAIELYNQEL